MANHKSARKAIRQIKKRTFLNKSRLNRVKTFIKKAEKYAKENDAENALSNFKIAKSEASRAVSKGVLKKNNASRKISRLNKRIKHYISA
jgi:small subunit ribosomal protein S20